jgi:hypothetical protein
MLTAFSAIWSGRLMWVSYATSKFDREGNLTDQETKKQFIRYMTGFVKFVQKIKDCQRYPEKNR